MRSNILVLPLVAMSLYCCTKNSATHPTESTQLGEDSGCINRLVIPVTSQGNLSDTDFNLVKNLFTTNGIDFQNLRFSRTYRDSTFVGNGTFDFRNVYVIPYTNGLTTFTESLNYLFKDQIFYNVSGRLTKGTTLDTIPVLKLSQLRKLFIDDIQKFNNAGDQYKDSCVNAEFGYLNISLDTNENLVKAWHLTPKFNLFPEAYYQDSSGRRLVYSDGTVSGH